MSKRLIFAALALTAFLSPSLNAQSTTAKLDEEKEEIKMRQVELMNETNQLSPEAREQIQQAMIEISHNNSVAMHQDMAQNLPIEIRKQNENQRLADMNAELERLIQQYQ